MWSATVDWLDERYQVRTLMAVLLHVHIPRKAKTYYLGGITLFIFVVQVITGSLLTLYYQPTPDTAYDSVLFITSNVSFGWLIRSIHAWGANLMVVFAVLHLLRIYFQGVYKRPQEVTWAVGVLLLIVTLGFGFTGYLLPWDQRAYWASTIGSEFAGAMPGVGEWLLRLMRGGADVGEATLSRFFGAHVLFLPLALGLLLAVHLALIHQQGLTDPSKPARRPPPAPKGTEQQVAEKGKALPFFPHYVLSEVIAWYLIIGLLIILASLFPAGLEGKANPLETPLHAKPEWYFLSMYQMLKLIPRTVGVLAAPVIIAVLFFLPFLDRNPEREPRKRLAAIIIGGIILFVIIGFTFWGWFS